MEVILTQVLLGFLPVFALAINVFSHILSYRFRVVKSMLRAVVLGFGIGMLSLWAMTVILLEFPELGTLDPLSVLALNTLIYGMLGYSYFHFNNLGETARRIRILREFLDNESMTEKELLARYAAKDMLELRLGRLIRSGQIGLDDRGELSIKDRSVLRMAFIMVALKKLLLRNKTSDFLRH